MFDFDFQDIDCKDLLQMDSPESEFYSVDIFVFIGVKLDFVARN